MQQADISYQVIRSDRRTIAIQIRPDGQILVRSPRHVGQAAIHVFVESKAQWIEKQLEKMDAQPCLPALTDAEIDGVAQMARQTIPSRVAYFAPLVGVDYGRITIRTQRSRWGSCSGKGNLNFNCLLMLAPPEVADYVVVHELCHRKEMNHSPRFWAEVERILPRYRESRRWLKENGGLVIGRLP